MQEGIPNGSQENFLSHVPLIGHIQNVKFNIPRDIIFDPKLIVKKIESELDRLMPHVRTDPELGRVYRSRNPLFILTSNPVTGRSRVLVFDQRHMTGYQTPSEIPLLAYGEGLIIINGEVSFWARKRPEELYANFPVRFLLRNGATLPANAPDYVRNIGLWMENYLNLEEQK